MSDHELPTEHDCCGGCQHEHAQEPPAGERRSRRWWLGLVGAGLALLLLPGRALARKLGIKLSQAPQLRNVGGWAVLQVKDRELLLVRDSASSVKALSSACTHKHHKLIYAPGDKQLVCAGHGSRYDLSGKVAKGPATQALPSYRAELDLKNDRVIVDA